jgi:hypothetical protein
MYPQASLNSQDLQCIQGNNIARTNFDMIRNLQHLQYE